jgi:aspartate/methionine/tyrosine aminotransferase
MRRSVQPFHAMEISRLAHALEAEGRSVIHMELGQPSTGAPAGAIEVAHRVLDSDGMGYWESPRLKVGLSRHYGQSYGLDIDPDRFVLTCGASPAMVLALSANFDTGDRIAVARPGYPAYRNTLAALGLAAIEVQCGAESQYQLTAGHLAELEPAPAGVILASPANPTGTIIDEPELARIADVCRERHILVVSDEIYHGLTYGKRAQSMLARAPGTFVIGSFSKYFSMVGWRLGWLLVPPGDEQRLRAFAGNMFLTAPSLSQHAGLVALDAREELEGHRRAYERNRDLLLRALPKLGIDRIAPPDGAFYIYADIRHLTDDSLSFCRRLLLDTGVATAPGIDFDPLDGRHHVRVSFAVSHSQVQDAIDRLGKWLPPRGPVSDSRL